MRLFQGKEPADMAEKRDYYEVLGLKKGAQDHGPEVSPRSAPGR